MRENAHFPHITAPEKFHARIWGKCTTGCSETEEMGGKPHAARAERRTFPQHRCTKFLGCKDMGEMHGKGLGRPPEKADMLAAGQGGVRKAISPALSTATRWMPPSTPSPIHASRTEPPTSRASGSPRIATPSSRSAWQPTTRAATYATSSTRLTICLACAGLFFLTTRDKLA